LAVIVHACNPHQRSAAVAEERSSFYGERLTCEERKAKAFQTHGRYQKNKVGWGNGDKTLIREKRRYYDRQVFRCSEVIGVIEGLTLLLPRMIMIMILLVFMIMNGFILALLQVVLALRSILALRDSEPRSTSAATKHCLSHTSTTTLIFISRP